MTKTGGGMMLASFPHEVIRASAGSGKTHQLTSRYLGLLAAGVEPAAILATTFTRKAAGEILGRVLYRLAEAAADANAAGELARQLSSKQGTQQEFVALLRRMLRGLHRVRISTLDSFYIALAGSFSFELGLPAGWTIGEEADDEALRQEAIERLLQRDEADVLVPLYQRLTLGMTKRSVAGELMDIVRELYALQQETSPEVWRKIESPPRLPQAKLDELLARIEAVDLTEHAALTKPRADDLQRVAAEEWSGLLSKGLCGKVFTDENAFRNKPIPEALVALYEKLIQHLRGALIQPLADQTSATREFLDRFHAELWALKQDSGLLRFQEVTQSLVNAMSRQSLPAEALAFRLDGSIEHLLLDEFQDTSLAQWRVLEPLARRITQSKAKSPRSFFCVGDVKQAIYGWRGGLAEIFNRLEQPLGKLHESDLSESRRCAQPIIDAVNDVFGKLNTFEIPDKCRAGVAAWAGRFVHHTTFQKELRGYVGLHSGPMQLDAESLADHRARHCHFVAAQIGALAQQTPQATIGVLCRKKDTLARIMYELRALKVEASEESGNPLTDSQAVELLLSLCTLADHPGHSIAWFHLQHSPLKEHLQAFADPVSLAKHLRGELLANGYGEFVKFWSERLAPACDRRDLNRLQQFIEAAFAYQSRSTLRASDFVSWVRQLQEQDPSGARVRIMTMHAAKGLEFDIVVLPELDPRLTGQPPAFVVGRDDALNVNFVCRYADESTRKLLTAAEQLAFDQHRQQQAEESLSLLYVAMTRAKHALCMFIPGPREGRSNCKDAWYNLLLQGLAPTKTWTELAAMFEAGDAKWFEKSETMKSVEIQRPPRPAAISFRPAANERRRGLDHAAPSRREGDARVPTDHLFKPSEGTGLAAGTLYHAWFETIEWLDGGDPTENMLRAAAQKKRWDLPADTWQELDKLLAQFMKWLRDPTITGVLRRSAYADPKQPAFPTRLAKIWTKTLAPQQVERERRFLVPEGQTLWNGSFDRIVWLTDGQKTVAADVIDFKTDRLEPGDDASLKARKEHYRPQLEAYRQAAARIAGLSEECIAARLVFTFAGRVVEV